MYKADVPSSLYKIGSYPLYTPLLPGEVIYQGKNKAQFRI